ncbi:MAG TPA: phospholipase D-like domain-containing protein [Vicinamibacterales bacterium]|nr:phospholipase D-like domain-containing protein [Vicinamibacterales bacterium]
MTDGVKQALRKHPKPVFWVGFSLAIVGLVLYLAQDPATIHVESPVAAADPRFPDYVASLVGAAVHVGDSYTALHNGDEAYPAMLAAIEGARTRVNFETYVFNEGEEADRFIDALARAAQRGVVVRVVLDPIGSSLKSKSSDRLKAAGVKLAWFNPLSFFSLEDYNYRTHRKTLVVDGDVAFTGGMGVADHWLGHAQDKDHWRDSHFRIVGPAVRALEGSFYENWIETGGLSAPALDPELPPLATGARSVVVWSNPMTGASNVKLQYLLAIGAARKTIDIQSPYITLDASTQWSLDEARKRGVKIRLLAEGDVTDAMPVKHASRYDYQRLLDAGYELFEYQPTMMHTKAMIVDGIFSIIGSANFGNRSFELNDELTIGVRDAELAAQLTTDFETDIKSSKRLDAATWPKQRSFDGKINEWFWDFFGEMF